MLLPYLTPSGRSRRQVTQFGGIDYGEQAGAGELSESRNLSARRFPSLTQRRGREAVPPDWEEGAYGSPTALFAWQGKLVVVDGTTLYYDGQNMGELTAGEKQFAVVNTKLVIWPDKLYLDLDSKVLVNLEAEYQSAEGTTVGWNATTLNFQIVQKEGVAQQELETYRTDNDYSDRERVVRIKTYTSITMTANRFAYSGEKETTIRARDSYASVLDGLAGRYVPFRTATGSGPAPEDMKINYASDSIDNETGEVERLENYTSNAAGYFGRLTGGTSVDIDGDYDDGESHAAGYYYTWKFPVDVLSGETGSNPITESDLKVGDVVDVTLDGTEYPSLRITAITENSISFEGAGFGEGSTTETVVIKRTVPDLEYICESENRLWGVDAQGVIHASALGDPTNFSIFAGVSTDSYAVAVGSDGAWTGITAYSGSVLAFKERVVHKVIGSYPAEYAVYTYDLPGIQAGCHKSAAVLGEVLYYKARDGVYAYTGGTPYRVSQALGERRFQAAVAGVWERSLYLSMQEEGAQEGEGWGLWTLDTAAGLWMREDESHILDFAEADGILYALTPGGVYQTPAEGERVAWRAEFAPFCEDTQSRKRHDRLLLRLELEEGAWAQALVRRDGGSWERAWRGTGERGRSFLIPLFPRRCDAFQVCLEGEGGFVLRGMTWEYKTYSQR